MHLSSRTQRSSAMRYILSVLLALALIPAIGCGGGGGNSNPALNGSGDPGGILGPDSVSEGSSAQYKVERTADAVSSYQWTSNPTALGTFSNATSSSTTFKANAVNNDTSIEIQVVVTPQNGSPTLSKREIIIKDNPTGEVSNQAPIAAGLADPPSIQPGGFIQFRDGSVDPDKNDSIVKWEWDFSYDPLDGFKTENEAREPYIQYAEEGIYLVQLRITDSNGATDMFDVPLQVVVTDGYLAPVAKAVFFPQDITACEPVQFQNNGSYPQSGSSIVKYEWDWDNDGIYDSNGLYVDYTWDEPGTYAVQFRVTDNNGEIGELGTPMAVVVKNAAPTAIAGVSNSTVSVGQPATFDATGSYDGDCDGSLVSYEWDWDNDGVYDEEAQIAQHHFPYVGTYSVQLRVDDGEGATDVLDQPITIFVEAGVAQTWGGAGDDHGTGVTTDSAGNVYITGWFSGTVDFDPGPAVVERTASTTSSAFLSKFDPSGNLVWVASWSSKDMTSGNEVAVSTPGYVYVTGTDTLRKYNLAGELVWIYTSNRIGQGVTIDDQHGVYVTGHYIPNSSINPDCSLMLVDFDGNLVWERSWGGAGSDQCFDVAVDNVGDAVVTGHFTGDVDFDPGGNSFIKSSTNPTFDAFVSKFDSGGNFKWAEAWPATEGYGIITGTSNQIYVTGYYEGDTDFDPGPGNLIYSGSVGSYITALTDTGAFIWAAGWTEYVPPPPTPNRDPGYEVAVDLDGNILVVGAFVGDVDFDPTLGFDVHNDGGAYMTMYSQGGTYLDTLTWGVENVDEWDKAMSVDVDDSGICYVSGTYHNSVDFGLFTDPEIHNSNGGADVFLMRMTPDQY